EGRGGRDTINAGDGDDLVKIGVPSTTGFPTVEGGPGHDVLALTATANNDNLTVTGPSGAVTVAAAGGAIVTANSVEELYVDLGAGADTITIEELSASSAKQVTVDAGQIVTDTGQTVLVTDADNPDLKIQKPVLIYADDHAADTITVRGRSSNDSF